MINIYLLLILNVFIEHFQSDFMSASAKNLTSTETRKQRRGKPDS